MKRHLIGLFISALLLALAGLAVLWDVQRQLNEPLRVVEPMSLDLVAGSRLRDAVVTLRRQGLFGHARQPVYLEVWARITGEAARIKAGEYRVEPGITPLGLLKKMVRGDVVMHELRLVEGQRYADLLARLRAHPQVVQTLGDADGETLMVALGHPELHPEGRFFPDTYRFPKGTRDLDLLRQSFDAMSGVLQSEWAERAADLPYASMDEALVMASIIEKETGLASERETIAGVFVRRLRRGMLLQTDPTVIYGLGEAFDGNLRKRDLLADGPYNTYKRAGLPPSPICLPGRAAIHAALHPADGDALYFVSRGDGSHQFSATLAEHEAAVRRYQLGGRRAQPVDPAKAAPAEAATAEATP